MQKKCTKYAQDAKNMQHIQKNMHTFFLCKKNMSNMQFM